MLVLFFCKCAVSFTPNLLVCLRMMPSSQGMTSCILSYCGSSFCYSQSPEAGVVQTAQCQITRLARVFFFVTVDHCISRFRLWWLHRDICLLHFLKHCRLQKQSTQQSADKVFHIQSICLLHLFCPLGFVYKSGLAVLAMSIVQFHIEFSQVELYLNWITIQV